MRKTATTLTAPARKAIDTAEVLPDGRGLRLSDHLARPIYDEVAVALKRVGFTWDRKTEAHLVSRTTTSDQALAQLGIMRTTGVAPAKNPLGWYPTPTAIAARVAEACRQAMNPKRGLDVLQRRVLEPSAGEGALLMALIRAGIAGSYSRVTAFEIDNERAEYLERRLRGRFKDLTVVRSDFLQYDVPIGKKGEGYGDFDDRGYHLVVMNPPFDAGAAVKHILHAWTGVIPGGRLVAIAPSSTAIRELVDKHGGMLEALPDNSFAKSDTGVSTVLLTLDKPSADSKPASRQSVPRPRKAKTDADAERMQAQEVKHPGVFLVPCRHCGAAIGVGCRQAIAGPNGKIVDPPHADRLRDSERSAQVEHAIPGGGYAQHPDDPQHRAECGFCTPPTPEPKAESKWVWTCAGCGTIASPVPPNHVCRSCNGSLKRQLRTNLSREINPTPPARRPRKARS